MILLQKHERVLKVIHVKLGFFPSIFLEWMTRRKMMTALEEVLKEEQAKAPSLTPEFVAQTSRYEKRGAGDVHNFLDKK